MSLLGQLPDELVQQILYYISPQDTLSAITGLSKRFYRIAQEPLLWKYYCQTTFKYWQADHDFKTKVGGKLHHVDWKQLYLVRRGRNARIAQLMDGIVKSRISRLDKTEQICRFGYDAKDYLLSQCRIDDSADDVLARRYYACNALDSIHRGLAIEEWVKYQRWSAHRIVENTSGNATLSCGMKLEKALGAFDMFVLHDSEGDLEEISDMLDDMALQFRTAHPNCDTMTTRQRAVALTAWLHSNNLTGLNDPTEQTYRCLRNCLIGRALRDDQHPSLPIISAAIFSCIASRIGLEAFPAALPSHVHAMVLSPVGVSLDGISVPGYQDYMFLDPYGSDDEVPLEDVRNFLLRLGMHPNSHADLMRPTSTDMIVMRTAQNIRASFTSFRTRERPLSQLVPLIELDRGDWARNLQPALYSMLWASIMMIPILPDNDDVRWDWQQDVRDLMRYFFDYFPEDSWLVEKYVCPMYDTFGAHGPPRLSNWQLPSKRFRDLIREIRRQDASERIPRLRSELPKGVEVKFRVGQVFKHKRYGYHGLILGWSVDGASNMANWEYADPLDSARKGCFPPLYQCMVSTDGSDHHVAEGSIEPVNLEGGGIEFLPPDIRDLVSMAGKHFKRWDGERGLFVSNMKELYPED